MPTLCKCLQLENFSIVEDRFEERGHMTIQSDTKNCIEKYLNADTYTQSINILTSPSLVQTPLTTSKHCTQKIGQLKGKIGRLPKTSLLPSPSPGYDVGSRQATCSAHSPKEFILFCLVT